MTDLAFAQINTSFFPYKDTYQVRGSLSDLEVLNLTSDTLRDVLVTDFANDNITLFYNIGGCPNSLSLSTYITTDHGPAAIETADFNLDGRMDFLVLNVLSHSVCVFDNHISPSGVVTILPASTYELNGICQRMLVSDLDGDGRQDLLISQGIQGSVYVLRNTSTTEMIQFDPPVLLMTTGMELKAFCAEDFNGDGTSDLVFSCASNGKHFLLFQNQSSPGNMSFLSPVDLQIAYSPTVIKTGDIDADGKIDLVLNDQQNGKLLLLHNEFSGSRFDSTSFASPVYIDTPGGITDIELEDLNGDHKLDIVATHSSENKLTVSTNRCGTGTWNESIFSQAQTLWSGDAPLALHIADLNGDGRKDILHTNQEFRNLAVQYKKNMVRESTTMTFPASAANYYSRYNPGDFILTGIGSGILTWYADSSLHQWKGTGNQFHTPWLERTDTFYVTNSESCNESDPIAVIAAIRCSILPPVAVSAYRCGAGSLTLEAVSNEQMCWYKKPTKDTVLLQRGNRFYIPYSDHSDTFYVAAVREECRSQRTAVVASIYPMMHATEVKAEKGICSSSGIHVYIPSSQKGIRYYLLENETLHSYAGNGSFLSLGNYPFGTTLAVSSVNHCDSISLNIEYLDSQVPVIPNLVTANEDQKNDAFYILNLPASSHLSIYNTWGIQVFASNDYQNDWGAGQPSGIYFYELRSELCGKIEHRSGWLQVVSDK